METPGQAMAAEASAIEAKQRQLTARESALGRREEDATSGLVGGVSSSGWRWVVCVLGAELYGCGWR
jgi:hypothetical protein